MDLKMGLEVTADAEVTPGPLSKLIVLCQQYDNYGGMVPVAVLRELISEFDGSQKS